MSSSDPRGSGSRAAQPNRTEARCTRPRHPVAGGLKVFWACADTFWRSRAVFRFRHSVARGVKAPRQRPEPQLLAGRSARSVRCATPLSDVAGQWRDVQSIHHARHQSCCVFVVPGIPSFCVCRRDGHSGALAVRRNRCGRAVLRTVLDDLAQICTIRRGTVVPAWGGMARVGLVLGRAGRSAKAAWDEAARRCRTSVGLESGATGFTAGGGSGRIGNGQRIAPIVSGGTGRPAGR